MISCICERGATKPGARRAPKSCEESLSRDTRDKLSKYREKRTASKTPEPFGGAFASPRLFVVQKHAARRLHYDLRLEMGGVLVSWAVPRGPSLDPAEKRLAVHVEDHPVEYGGFEGIIPDGNYGAGTVILWDRGVWVPIEDPEAGMEKGKLLFDLRGYKLRGRWTLVRTKGKERQSTNEWLLIKKADGWARAEGTEPFPQESILSGQTIEELRDGSDRAAEIRETLGEKKAPQRRVRAADVKLMLAERRERPFSRKGWIFELKYDGFRLLAARDHAEVKLLYRRGHDSTATFPDLSAAVSALPFERFILDGELVVLDEGGRPSFQRLQQRVQLTRRVDIAQAAVTKPATLYCFDLLAFDDFDLRPLSLLDRKEVLRSMLPRSGPLRYADHIETEGEALFRQVEEMGLEGVIGKQADARYRGGRSSSWIKIRAVRTGDFIIAGYTLPKAGRTGFGALHVAARKDEDLVYAGRVGTGFSERELGDLRATMDEWRRDSPPCRGPTPKGDRHQWIEPRLVVEVRYLEWTDDHLLRHPVFVRLRDDKAVEDCGPEEDVEPAVPQPEPVVERKVPFSNLDKTFWPEEGYTKGDLIEYYRRVGPFLLPYLKDRPVVLTRYPDGIAGKSFFQKDAPGFIPGWLRTERIWSEHASREIDYFLCDDLESLLYLINLGSIPLHIWSSRIGSISKPDWCILDLDPKKAPFSDVVQVAKALKGLCDEIGLPSFVKTSGSTGIHVLVPLAGRCTYEQSRQLGELLSRVIVSRMPEIATIQRVISARGRRVYLDYLQNGHGRLLVSPYSVRPLPGAPVSAPLRWREVGKKLEIGQFTIKTLPARVERQRSDPFAGVLTDEPDLFAILERLGGLVEASLDASA